MTFRINPEILELSVDQKTKAECFSLQAEYLLISRFHCVNILYYINPLMADMLQDHKGKTFYFSVSQEFYMCLFCTGICINIFH